MPTHVSGGIPIQRYLRTLLDRVPQVVHDDQFSVVSRDNVGVDGSDPSIPSLNTSGNSSQYRDAFVDDLMQWFQHHVRVKVRIQGAERSVYVWQSFQDPPVAPVSDDAESVSHDGSSADPLDQNIPLESLSSESQGSDPQDVQVQPQVMFQR